MADLELFDDSGVRTVLCVVAHPDDMEYGGSAAVARWTRRGATVSYLLLTAGEAGIRDCDPRDVATLRQREQEAACHAVGVTDLREALEGRSSMSNPNLVAGRVPSISTLDHTSSVFPEGFGKLTPTRSRPQQRVKPRPGEVKDVLNKLGIGKQNAGKANGGAILKSSFQAIQKTQSR